MNQADTHSIVNRILAIHHRSLPMYLSDATPWMQQAADEAQETMDAIVADQKDTVDRLATFIVETGGDVDYGEFPLQFTSLHDLAFDYLLGKMLERQQHDIQFLQQAVASLTRAPMARALAEQSVGAAEAHRDMMHELLTASQT